ncbi:S41 family peptidase [Acidobacteria bacterium AH-259-O06]|nr:S41 family peptidase [Acidobacteria bacterium AH-259-O06]
MRNRLGIFFLTTILSAALFGGWLGAPLSASAPLSNDTERLLKTFTGTLALVKEHYVEPVPTQELVENAIRGLLRTLDPHSSFFSSSDYNRLQEEQRGKYYGLGISIRPESPGSGRVVVVEPPAPETPAYRVGLKAGDVISKIEGQPIDDWDLNKEVIPNLKGPKGTKVTITVERPGEAESLELTVVRDEIPLYTIKYAFHIRPHIGYIKINRFSETTRKELDDALEKEEEENLKGLILDLRDNPGGALGQAIAVADRFLQKNQVIVSTRSRDRKTRRFTAPKGSRSDYPMVVLINQSSASASEIVAGALQDHDRALIVGETSFGKALVQTIYRLGDNKGLALTTGKYYTPSNRLIQRDFANSFYEYFFSRAGTHQRAGEESRTDSGRVVFGGGGITPDVEVSLKGYSKLGRLIDRENLFAEFAAKLTEGAIHSDIRYEYDQQERAGFTQEERKGLTEGIKITEETLRLFKEFLSNKKVDFSDESFEESRQLIENRLKRELFLTLFGSEEGFKVGLEIDHQVQRAIELLPQATALIQNNSAEK